MALLPSQQQHTRNLVGDLAGCMELDDADHQMVHQEIVAAVAAVVDDYLTWATKPTTS